MSNAAALKSGRRMRAGSSPAVRDASAAVPLRRTRRARRPDGQSPPDARPGPDRRFGGTRDRSPIRGEPKKFTGINYLLQFALPNFSFHTTTAYAILRHNGVEIGKADFIGALD
jgi:hypothetical protein